MASIDENVRRKILDITQFSLGNLPFRYLGISLASTCLRTSDYSLLVDAITSKINSWPRQSLSYAGKIELLRSVIQGVECFWLSILPIPSNIIDIVYAICRKFVWATKHPPIAWKMLCKQIEDGGMGLKDLSEWNKALIAKTLWKIHSKKDSLWIRWVNNVYSEYDNVWCWDCQKEDSSLIKQIIRMRDIMVDKRGSIAEAICCLQSWFDRDGGLSSAYEWKPLLMKSCILPKHRFVLRLFAHRKLLTRDKLVFSEDKRCGLCNVADENMARLFFICPTSEKIWACIRQWFCMRKIMGSDAAVLRAFRNNYRGNSTLSKMRTFALAATMYHIWNARNRSIFANEKPHVDAIINKIKLLIFRLFPSLIYTVS